MQDTERAVERLTTAHTEHTDAGPVEWPPLLTWLKSRVTEIVGRKGGSSAGAGVPLNAEALEVLNYIEGRYRLMCAAAFIAPTADIVAGVTRVWQILRDDRNGGRIDDSAWERIETEFPDWVTRIEAEDDRPRKMELTVPCPRCDERWVTEAVDPKRPDLDKRVAAVVIEFAPGRAPVAECRASECGAMWAGWGDVARLGFTVGAEQDRAVLAAAGISVSIE